MNGKAEDTGRALSHICFSNVYASDLVRAIETAEIIMDNNRRNGGQKIHRVKDLRERHLGSAECYMEEEELLA